MSTVTEIGYYHHTNGKGREEIVYVDFYNGCYYVTKHGRSDEQLIDHVIGAFGDRIPLPSEGQ